MINVRRVGGGRKGWGETNGSRSGSPDWDGDGDGIAGDRRDVMTPCLDGRIMLTAEGINRLLDPLSHLLPRGRLCHSEFHSGFVHGLLDGLCGASETALSIVSDGLGVHLGLFVLEGGGLNREQRRQHSSRQAQGEEKDEQRGSDPDRDQRGRVTAASAVASALACSCPARFDADRRIRPLSCAAAAAAATAVEPAGRESLSCCPPLPS